MERKIVTYPALLQLVLKINIVKYLFEKKLV